METPREPHSVSLKVLRLSRPSLFQSVPLPRQASTPIIDSSKALNVPNGVDQDFSLSPILTLPPAFGQAYVGETFSCTLCANNELLDGTERVITGVKIGADMQTPSGTIPLELTPADEDSKNHQLEPAESLQKIVRFDLREEGNHVLAVSLSYSETTISKDKSASSGRVRTFRKLYQFAAQPCLSVRTKISEFPTAQPDKDKSPPSNPSRFALEAQLENVADGSILLEKVSLNTKAAFQSTSLNWDTAHPDGRPSEPPSLVSRDVMQVAFLIEERKQDKAEVPPKELKDGRTVLGQLTIQWRTTMGDTGVLTTGWLMTKKH